MKQSSTSSNRPPVPKKANAAPSSAAYPNEPTHEQIAQRAYELWKREGCPEGQAIEHWRVAEQVLRGQAEAASPDFEKNHPLPRSHS